MVITSIIWIYLGYSSYNYSYNLGMGHVTY